jgi:transcriptional regulator with XRE-family HTH domain
MEKIEKKIGLAVTSLREAKRLSKSKMGAVLGGITPQAVLRYESGKKIPEVAVLWRLAGAAALDSKTQHLLPVFLSCLTSSCGTTLHGSLLGVLASAECPCGLPDTKAMGRILKRARELLDSE